MRRSRARMPGRAGLCGGCDSAARFPRSAAQRLEADDRAQPGKAACHHRTRGCRMGRRGGFGCADRRNQYPECFVRRDVAGCGAPRPGSVVPGYRRQQVPHAPRNSLSLHRQGRRQIRRHCRGFGSRQNPSRRIYAAHRRRVPAVRLDEKQRLPHARSGSTVLRPTTG